MHPQHTTYVVDCDKQTDKTDMMFGRFFHSNTEGIRKGIMPHILYLFGDFIDFAEQQSFGQKRNPSAKFHFTVLNISPGRVPASPK